MKRYFMLFALLLALPVQSLACDWIEVGVGVYHVDRSKSYNEDGPLIGCEINNYHFRYFKNSHDWDSFAITKQIQIIELYGIELGIEAGVVKGYRDKLLSFKDVLNPALEHSIGAATWRNLDKISPWATPNFSFSVDDNSRIACQILGNAGIACTLALRGW